MLYPHHQDKALSPELFGNPGSEYRGAPFWAWNCDLKEEQLVKQLDILKEMGLGGAHMHCRSGMSTPYLTDEFMALVKACVEKCRKEGMLAWLYDEDRWPSGAAGGYVTRDKAYRSRYLLLTKTPYSGDVPEKPEDTSRSVGARNETGALLARYQVDLNQDGCLAGYRMLAEDEASDNCWYAYLEISGDSPWYNNQAYLDTLNPAAVRKFIEITHERYLACVGKDFGGVIPAIFTDEPQFTHKGRLGVAGSAQDVCIPWTDDLEESFRDTYGESLLAGLPEVFWELPCGAVSALRYRYHDHIAERFAQAFADQCGAWCERHGLMLTGHMMDEPTLESQTAALGDAMRSYRSFQLPGIDMLCDWREYTTAKQAQSAARQYNRPGVLSELYGVTGWDFDFRGHKLQGDWQAALGVTVRVQHLSWVSMEGAAKRDYPASINYQSPWYKEYKQIEDYFARVNTAFTRGKARARVAVVHPVESYWLHFGPLEQTGALCAELDERFAALPKWLLNGLIDFDYISESLLPSLCSLGGNPLRVGECAYEAVLVPACETLRHTTLDRLEAFRNAGGTLIFAGDAPKYEDAMPSERGKALAECSQCVPFSRHALLQALAPFRDIDVRDERGMRPETLVYQLRQDGDARFLFLCNGGKPANQDILQPETLTLRIEGEWKPTLYDAMTGDIRALPFTQENGRTVVPFTYNAHDSLLLRLEQGRVQGTTFCAQSPLREVMRFPGAHPVTLSEPNVLLLDSAEYAVNDGAWQQKAELLRVDEIFRKTVGLPERGGQLPQPWVMPEDKEYAHFLRLRFTIISQVAVDAPKLALERPELAKITWNGQPVPSKPIGWFVDESIRTVALPPVQIGRNILEIQLPIGQRVGVEWCYLLGDFGVSVLGDEAELIAPVRSLHFGDWTRQGLPFYAGNVTYHLQADLPKDCYLEATHFRNPLLALDIDGKRIGTIALAPYRVHVQRERTGECTLDLTAFGNRFNAFGALHNCNYTLTWHGPDAWHSRNAAWAGEWQLKPTGVLVSPKIMV